ncbi:MAG TPA: nuclear transport factor 2 family protein [Terriglobales bacterium]|jgi:ketosteroid isomerase-like protein|nr:nuclear transport factor 2 family protein [Terriglobales bacterium]
MKLAKNLQVVLLLCAGSALYAQSSAKSSQARMCPTADLAAIKQQWSEWTAAYASHNLAKTMEIFDPEVIFSFQGSPDQNFADLERGYKDEFTKPDNKLEWVPQFEEFECSGDLGFVRSTWVLRQTDASGKVTELEKNRGVDLFRRQHRGGKWKIFRSLNYPFQPPKKD